MRHPFSLSGCVRAAHSFCPLPQITVRDFKSHIQPAVNVDSDQQRLIYCGKVLADEKKLAEYEMDGKTVHLVVRVPPVAGPESGTEAPDASASGRRSAPPGSGYENGQLFGAFYVPRAGFAAGGFQQIVQDVISNLGDLGRNATVMSTASADGSSVDVHINLGHISGQTQTNYQVQSRVTQIRQLLQSVDRDLRQLEHPDTQRNGQSSDGPAEPAVGPVPASSSGTSDAAEAAIAAAAAAETAAQLARQAAAAVAASVYSAGSRPPVAPQVRITARQVRVGPTAASDSGPGTRVTVTPAAESSPATGQRVTGPEPTSAVFASDFANIIRSVRECEDRLRSHVLRLEEVLRDTSATTSSVSQEENVRLHRNVSSVLHQFGHVYYLLSDLYVCFHQPNPRTVGLFPSELESDVPPLVSPTASPPVRPPRSASVPRTRSAGLSPASPATGIRVAATPVILVDYGPSVRIQTTAAAPAASGRAPAAAPASASNSSATTTAPMSASAIRVPIGVTATATSTRSVPISIPVAAVPVVQATNVPVDSNRGDSDWESTMPSAWLPIIRSDLMEQRTNPPARDSVFSEAYLNGIPNRKKRRTDGDDGDGGSRA